MVIRILNGASPFVVLVLLNLPLLFQFQKQGKDTEKVKQRLAEIANYVDKVTIKSPRGNKVQECDLLGDPFDFEI